MRLVAELDSGDYELMCSGNMPMLAARIDVVEVAQAGGLLREEKEVLTIEVMSETVALHQGVVEAPGVPVRLYLRTRP